MEWLPCQPLIASYLGSCLKSTPHVISAIPSVADANSSLITPYVQSSFPPTRDFTADEQVRYDATISTSLCPERLSRKAMYLSGYAGAKKAAYATAQEIAPPNPKAIKRFFMFVLLKDQRRNFLQVCEFSLLLRLRKYPEYKHGPPE